MIRINKRLESLCAFIKENEVVLDIGCDHGLLGIYLTLNRDNVRVISSDVNEKPLEKAQENVLKYNLQDKIETRLGDGLEVASSDINTVVISGMGGLNIIEILKNIRNYPNIIKLVLSPNNDFDLVRRDVGKLGFKIVKEEMVLEQGKYYIIIEFTPGKEKIDDYFGKLDLNDETVRSYYQYIYETNERILEELGNSDNGKRKTLMRENNIIKRRLG